MYAIRSYYEFLEPVEREFLDVEAGHDRADDNGLAHGLGVGPAAACQEPDDTVV